MNQFVIVGKLANEPTERITENGKKVYDICLSVKRSYKNIEGVYETDYLTFVAYAPLAVQTLSYCREGDMIGIKGRLEIHQAVMTPIVEKITFLSTSKKRIENGVDTTEEV